MSSGEAGDEGKTAELILLIAKHTEEDPTSGSTKLNKILYFAEISHLRRTGKPITGSDYQKQPHGPTLRRMPPIIRDLESQGAVKAIEEDYFGYAGGSSWPSESPTYQSSLLRRSNRLWTWFVNSGERAPRRCPTSLTRTQAGEPSTSGRPFPSSWPLSLDRRSRTHYVNVPVSSQAIMPEALCESFAPGTLSVR
jgi:hypothetical protein